MAKFLSIFFCSLFFLKVDGDKNPCPSNFIEKANGNYLILNDTNNLQITVGNLSNYRITISNAVLVKAKLPFYKIVPKNKKDVEIFICENTTMEVLYSKKFKVIERDSRASYKSETNTVNGCFSIFRLDDPFVNAGETTKFVYYSDIKSLKIECEGGKILKKTATGLEAKPDKGVAVIRFVFKEGQKEIGFHEFPVKN